MLSCLIFFSIVGIFIYQNQTTKNQPNKQVSLSYYEDKTRTKTFAQIQAEDLKNHFIEKKMRCFYLV